MNVIMQRVRLEAYCQLPEWITVAKSGELSAGLLKQVFVGNQELLLLNADGKIVATQVYCGRLNVHLHRWGKVRGLAK